MRTKEWQSLITPILPPGWTIEGRLAYKLPVKWVLRGVLADPSRRDKEFHLLIVRTPLYQPSTELDLSWCDRVGHNATYDINNPETVEVVRAAIRKVEREAGADELLARRTRNGLMLEASAYAYLLQGKVGDAARTLESIEDDPRDVEWVNGFNARKAEMLLLIQAGDVDEALERVKAWRLNTLKALGIDPG